MIIKKKILKHIVFLYSLIVIIGSYLLILLYFNESPQGSIPRIKNRITSLFIPKVEKPQNIINELPEIVDEFHQGNYGIIQRLNAKEDNLFINDKSVLREQLINAFGIYYDTCKDKGLLKTYVNISEYDTLKNIVYKKGTFSSYDGVNIPFYEFFPGDFNPSNQYPVLLIFSGHGSMSQLVSIEDSYQKAAALNFAKEGFVVFTMENRGMGELSYLGDHLRIDAVARLIGGSWYGEIITDGIYLLDYAHNLPYVDKQRIGVGGVSTGGALSMFVSAIDNRISATYVQGYFGSYRTTFGTRANHCVCNNIAGILKIVDLGDICLLIVPRSLTIINGEEDTFYWQDAEREFSVIKKAYEEVNSGENVSFRHPQGVGHEFSVDIASEYFNNVLFGPSVYK